jgi:hypothetical protein
MAAKEIFESEMRKKYPNFPVFKTDYSDLNCTYASRIINDKWIAWRDYLATDEINNPTEKDYSDFELLEALRKDY